MTVFLTKEGARDDRWRPSSLAVLRFLAARWRWRARVLLVLTFIGGCAPALHAIAVDPDVDFAAHTAHRGLIIDRMVGGSPAVLVPHPGWFTDNPVLLEDNGETIAAMWLKDLAHATVRNAPDRGAPVTGRVETTRQDGAIRLAFALADGETYGTGRFHRVDFASGAPFLGSDVTTVLDVRGLYRAEVRDAQGNPIGWLRVRIEPPEGALRIYDGVLPPALDGAVGAAAVELVNLDVDDIEGHAVDVYQGN